MRWETTRRMIGVFRAADVHTHEQEFARELDSGGIVYEKFTLPEGAFTDRELAAFTGGCEHRVLCARGAKWLDMLGKGWTPGKGSALGYQGGWADVLSRDGSVAIECGTTRCGKVLNGVEYGTIVVVVPHGGDGLAWSFQRTDKYEWDKRSRAAQRIAVESLGRRVPPPPEDDE